MSKGCLFINVYRSEGPWPPAHGILKTGSRTRRVGERAVGEWTASSDGDSVELPVSVILPMCTSCRLSLLLLLLPLSRSDWINRTAVVVSSIGGADVYDVRVEDGRLRRVLVIPTEPAEHASAQELLRSSCPTWIPTVSTTDKVNAYSCVFNATLIDSLVDDFVRTHSALLKEAHAIHRCQKRKTRFANQPQRVYVTALNTQTAPDVWHSDGCDRDTRAGQAYFTVLHYPHSAEWQEEWGGHLEFAPGECDGFYDGNANTKAPPILRLRPSPHRAVVFSGPLVHRATRPSGAAAGLVEGAPPTWIEEHGSTSAQDAWRYSFVRQLECAIVPDTAADGTPLGEKDGEEAATGGGATLTSVLRICAALGVCGLVLGTSLCAFAAVPTAHRPRFCRGCALLALCAFACPVALSRCIWQLVLPDLRWQPLAGLVTLASGVDIEPGDDWPFECAKLHCPAQSFSCLFDSDCRRVVLHMALSDPCPRGRHEAARREVCGTECSSAAMALLDCLEAEGRRCVYASGGQPAVVRRRELSEGERATLANLARSAAEEHGSTHHTAFGVAYGQTAHNVTFLQPLIYEHGALLDKLRSLVRDAALEESGWEIDDVEGLSLRCAAHLAYAGGQLSTGLGWHWDLGSTVTMVLMLESSNDTQNGKLQVSSECTTHDVPLERGDVAIYPSRQRHRFMSVTKRRSVVVLEWWRGEATMLPGRPPGDARLLMEPATRELRLTNLASSALRRALTPWGAWRDLKTSGGGAAGEELTGEEHQQSPRTQMEMREHGQGEAEEEVIAERVEL